jgi:glycosyl transferase family 87
METLSTTNPQIPLADPPAPSLSEISGLAVLSYAIFYAALFWGSGLPLVGGNAFGDNPAYLKPAAAIQHWQFAGVEVHQFWGASYATAFLSTVTRIPLRPAFVILCVAASLAALMLCHRLWGGWVAAFFCLLSLDWFQRSLLGGAEPLFIALILAAFFALRRGQWAWSALFAALATVVRPYGLFALLGLGIQLLCKRRFRECFYAILIALLIGGLYAWPLAHYFGNPLANVASYQHNDWHGNPPFTFPFASIVRDTLLSPAPLTNRALTSVWALLMLSGILIAIKSGDLRKYASSYPAEACFACLYWVALFTYSSREFARAEFPRFALPVLPWILAFLYGYLPKQRWVVWSLAVVTPTLAAASAIGIRNVVPELARHLH